jgi:hypothetical protein
MMTITRYPIHPICAEWPDMPDDEFAALVEDIRKHGVRIKAHVTADNVLIDGKTRQKACELLGIELPVEIFAGPENAIIDFTISVNMKRKHLPKHTLAFIGSALEKLKHGHNRYCKVESPAGDSTGIKATRADILTWSEEQAVLLRRRDANALDWDNLAEEVEDLGKAELNACRSLLRQAMRHMLKAQAWPVARDAPTWRADAAEFIVQARDHFTPSMRQRIDIAELYASVLGTLPTTNDGMPPQAQLPKACPWTLEELLQP